MRYLLAGMVIGLFLGADAPKGEGKQEKEKLQGIWQAVAVQERGESKGDAEAYRLIFSGDQFRVKKGDATIIKGKWKIDASKKPKEIDLEFTEHPKDEFKGRTALGIYELDKDNLERFAVGCSRGHKPECAARTARALRWRLRLAATATHGRKMR